MKESANEGINVINGGIEVLYNQECLDKLKTLVGSQIKITNDGDVKFNEKHGWFSLPEHSFIYQKPDGSWTVF